MDRLLHGIYLSRSEGDGPSPTWCLLIEERGWWAVSYMVFTYRGARVMDRLLHSSYLSRGEGGETSPSGVFLAR